MWQRLAVSCGSSRRGWWMLLVKYCGEKGEMGKGVQLHACSVGGVVAAFTT
jgi:hypothetical protein